MMTSLRFRSAPVGHCASILLAAGVLFGASAARAAGDTPAEAPPTATPVSAAPSPSSTVPVVERWRQAIEAKLAAIDPNAPALAAPVGTGPSLKLGHSGERVDRLAAQLTARGLLPAGTYTGLYDEALGKAVKDFQASEGIAADGLVGEGTIDALDRTPAQVTGALKATLADMKQLAANPPREFFLVNIPSQTAYLIQGTEVAMAMRVAVGRPSRQTPVLSDRITDIILNPTWTAPTTVLAKDKLPSLRRTGHPGIEGATIYLDGMEVDPAMVDWSAVTPERLRIVQSPGNQNALGRFKFNLTNGESIYLHDTNDHSVFARSGRAISSGCVRLAEPRRFAETLLGREGWSPERITHALENGHTQDVGLSRTIPVRIVYWQATVDDTGTVRVHRDIYGRNGQAPVAAAPAAPAASDRPVAHAVMAPRPVEPAATVSAPALAPTAVPATAQTPATTQGTTPQAPTARAPDVVPLREMQVGDAVIKVPAASSATAARAAPAVAASARVRAREVATKPATSETVRSGWGLY